MPTNDDPEYFRRGGQKRQDVARATSNDPKEIRARGIQALLKAETETDPEIRHALVMLAAEYDQLAAAIEREMPRLRHANENSPGISAPRSGV